MQGLPAAGHSTTLADVLQGFAPAQPAQLALMCAHISGDFVWVCPRIRPQRPTDCLADEEVAVREVRLDVRVQQLEVGVALERELADDRDATLPEVGVFAPGAHQRPDLFRM